jgi:hypothetical protein
MSGACNIAAGHITIITKKPNIRLIALIVYINKVLGPKLEILVRII